MTKTSRRQREADRHRREVLKAALGLFSRNGYEKTTMAQIAERAEFAVGTLYKFFEDKKALYRALIFDTVQEFERALTAALQAPGTEFEKLERYIETKTELFVRHIPTARLYFAQTAGAKFQPVAGLDREGYAIYQQVLAQLESVFRRGIRKGMFVKTAPPMLALGLEGISNAFLDALIERPDDFTAEEMAALIKGMFFDSVRIGAING